MEYFEIENAIEKKTKHRRNQALAFAVVIALVSSCAQPNTDAQPTTPTYSATIWEKTITVKDERSDKTASIDTLVSKLQAALTNISSGLDTIIGDPDNNASKSTATSVKSAITTVLNRGFTITVSDTAVTSTEKVKVVDNKTILINSDFLTTEDLSWADKSKIDISNPNAALEKLMHSMYDSGSMALNLKAKNAVQLAVKPAMLAQKGKSLAALDMKKRNNSAT